MDVNGVGWIAAIIIGGLAGWLAEMFMKSNMGLLMNIILGIVGAHRAECNTDTRCTLASSASAGWPI